MTRRERGQIDSTNRGAVPRRPRHAAAGFGARAARAILGAALLLALAGCDRDAPQPPLEVWGRRGFGDGRFQKPRAMTIDAKDQLYIVDMTARIQVFDPHGKYLRGWQTPAWTTGKPTGLSISHDGNLLVADTHYYRVLIYSPEGKLLRTMGGTRGEKPGEFGLVTDVVQDSHDNYYVSEYGDFDRIQKFTPDGKFVLEWGGHGAAPGEFSRPQNMAIDDQDHIWVADACNHRIQVFDSEGKLLSIIGKEGGGPGEFYYPYDVQLGRDGAIYVCEYGNSRVQKLSRQGEPLAIWGREGSRPGELFNPWALVHDSHGRLYVLDSNNHRVQVIEM